jgi:plasmid stabilization system protein ParE
LIVTITYEANQALKEIWAWNARAHGEEHAEEYVQFLLAETEKLADHPELGRVVDSRPKYRALSTRWKTGGHGHIAVYRVEPPHVKLMDYVHTAQDVERHIGRLPS